MLDGGGGGEEEGAVVSGWRDGCVRCHDLARLCRTVWTITNAHRGGVLSVVARRGVELELLVTGGMDGAVRVWRLSSRELVAQFNEHCKPVFATLVDIRQSHILHSAALDGTVVSVDLHTLRRVMGHSVARGAQPNCLSQRPDGEQELVTADNHGRILLWDIDVLEPVCSVQDPTRFPIKTCAVSPSGSFLAYAGDECSLKVLRLSDMAELAVGYGHSLTVRTVTWTPDERQIVTGGDDCSVCVWNFFAA